MDPMGKEKKSKWSLFHVHLERVTFGWDFAAKPFDSKGASYSLQSPAWVAKMTEFFVHVTTSLDCSVEGGKMGENPETNDDCFC